MHCEPSWADLPPRPRLAPSIPRPEWRVHHVRVIGRTGGRIGDTDLVPGLVLSKHRIDPNTPARLKGRQNHAGGWWHRTAVALIRWSPADHGPHHARSIPGAEQEQLEDLIDRIASQGVNLLVVREGIDDLAVAPLREVGIVAYRRVDRSISIFLPGRRGRRWSTIREP